VLGTPKYNILIIPTTFPTNAPKVSSGKNIPPGTPEPKHTNVNKNLTRYLFFLHFFQISKSVCVYSLNKIINNIVLFVVLCYYIC
jgi:hypothetical protein